MRFNKSKWKFSCAFEEVIPDHGEVACIIEYGVDGTPFISAYANVPEHNNPLSCSAQIVQLYLSQCEASETFAFKAHHLDWANANTTRKCDVFVSAEAYDRAIGTLDINNLATTKKPPKGVTGKKKYKPVALKVKPVIAALPSEFHIERNIIGDPLEDMPALSPNPPPFTPNKRYTAKRRDIVEKRHNEFLQPEEMCVLHDLVLNQSAGLAWSDSECRSFKQEFFPPVEIPVVPHTP